MEQLNKNPKEFADIKDVKLDDAYHRRFWGFNLGFRQVQCAAGAAQDQDFEILDKTESGEVEPKSQELPSKVDEQPKKRCSWFRSHYCRKNQQNDATLSDQVNDLNPQFVSMEGVANFADLPDDKKQQLYEQWQRHFRFGADGEIQRSYPQFSAYRIAHHQGGFRCRLGKNYQNEIPLGNFKPWVGWDFKRDQF